MFCLILLVLPFFFACEGGSSTSLEEGEDEIRGISPTNSTFHLEVSYPRQNQLVSGIMTAEVEVSLCSNSMKLEVVIDGATTRESNISCEKVEFDANNLSDGDHTLAVKVGNTFSPAITVKVDSAELRKQALQYLRDYNTLGQFAGVRRWPSTSIKIEVSKDMASGLVSIQKAADFWSKHTGLDFQVIESAESQVNSSTGKSGVTFFEYGTPNSGFMSTQTNVDVNLIHTASLTIAVRGSSGYTNGFAHEIGHAIGIWANVNDGSVTDGFFPTLEMNPVTAEAIRILYFELAPGSAVPLQ